MSIRDDQAAAVVGGVNQWLEAIKAFDAAHAADVAALQASNAAFNAYNNVAWKLQDHSGATDAEKLQALQLKMAYEDLRAKYDQAFAATTAASAARNNARQSIRAAVDALDTNPGEVENTGGTILGGTTVVG